MPTYIVLLGPPGAGKGTQAKILSTELGIPQVSTGDLFRAMKTQDTPFARKVQEIMASGALVPDDVTIQMVKERLHQIDCDGGAILDGFPRTTAQAEALGKMLAEEFNSSIAVVPLLTLDENDVVRRISGRRQCPECKTIYNVDPSDTEATCPKDGEKLELREDDKPGVVQQRYSVYLENTAPLVDYYRNKGLLAEFDAKQTVEKVTGDLLSAIRSRIAAG